MAHAGVVHQHVERAEARDARGDGALAGRGVGHVAGQGEAVPAVALELRAQALEAVRVAVEGDDACPGGGEAERDRTAEAACRSA